MYSISIKENKSYSFDFFVEYSTLKLTSLFLTQTQEINFRICDCYRHTVSIALIWEDTAGKTRCPHHNRLVVQLFIEKKKICHI